MESSCTRTSGQRMDSKHCPCRCYTFNDQNSTSLEALWQKPQVRPTVARCALKGQDACFTGLRSKHAISSVSKTMSHIQRPALRRDKLFTQYSNSTVCHPHCRLPHFRSPWGYLYTQQETYFSRARPSSQLPSLIIATP